MRFRKLLIAITLCLSLFVVVSAHPGRTDSDGGHTNHSTGEYHYHHGYSAHKHRDLDGDGDLDCPYLFDDKTGSSGNKSESSGTKTESTKETTKKRTAEDYFKIICYLALVLFFITGFFVDGIKKRFKK
jgi:hypothetical protein